jgi:hypothetical protein
MKHIPPDNLDDHFLSPSVACSHCKDIETLNFDFTFAYQPILDLKAFNIFIHEALVLGINSKSAFRVLAKINDCNRYRFYQDCRDKAVKLAAQLDR